MFALTINGFNGAKSYVTKVVEIPLNINNELKIVNAICVPNININLHVPRIGVLASKLIEKGYVLAG